MKKLICLFSLLVSACSTTPVAVVVDLPDIPVLTPTDVARTNIVLHVFKDEQGNTMYSFDEINFIKLKKFLLDITKNNNNTRDLICYYHKETCEKKEEKK